MKIIIAGSRELIVEPKVIAYELLQLIGPFQKTLEVVSGGARGVDKSGEAFADQYGYRKKVFPADWHGFGKAAGNHRNENMAQYADAALLFFKQRPSPGTSNMLAWMAILKKPWKVVTL